MLFNNRVIGAMPRVASARIMLSLSPRMKALRMVLSIADLRVVRARMESCDKGRSLAPTRYIRLITLL